MFCKNESVRCATQLTKLWVTSLVSCVFRVFSHGVLCLVRGCNSDTEERQYSQYATGSLAAFDWFNAIARSINGCNIFVVFDVYPLVLYAREVLT